MQPSPFLVTEMIGVGSRFQEQRQIALAQGRRGIGWIAQANQASLEHP